MDWKQTVCKSYRKARIYLRYHSTTLLTCIGAIGVVATAVTAVRATPKAMRLLDMAKKEKDEALTRVEIVQIAAPVYIPAAAIGMSTIACIFGAHALNKKNQAALAGAYSLLNQSYQRYRNAAKTLYGEDVDSKIKIQAAKDVYVSAGGYYLYSPDIEQKSEKTLFYDMYSQRYFTSTFATVLNAQYHLNRNLSLRGDICLNEFYTFLGLDEVGCGYSVGWSWEDLAENGYVWLDFENVRTTMEDGIECYIITAAFEPTVLYVELD